MSSEKKERPETSKIEDIADNLAAGEISELVVVAEGEERTTWFVWLLVFCSSISGLLFGAYPIHAHNAAQHRAVSVCSQAVTVANLSLSTRAGYDTGVISGALVTIGGDLGPAELSSGQKVRAQSQTILPMMCNP